MHLFELAFFIAGVYHAIFQKQELILPFLAIIGAYFLIGKLLVGSKDVSTRKKIMIATWTDPNVGAAVVRMQPRVDKILKLIQQYPKNERPTISHFIIKALGEMIKIQPDLNGSLALGKFKPYETVDISYLTTINQGKDIAKILVKDVDKKSIEEIRDTINEQLQAIKSGRQEVFIKEKSILKLIPSTFIGFFAPILFFIHNKLGFQLGFLGKSHSFGAAIIVDVGNLNLQDTALALVDSSNTTGVVTICAPFTAPVVEEDQVVIGNVIQTNFVMDHRWIDGGRCTKLFPTFNKVMKEPQLYVASHKPQEK